MKRPDRVVLEDADVVVASGADVEEAGGKVVGINWKETFFGFRRVSCIFSVGLTSVGCAICSFNSSICAAFSRWTETSCCFPLMFMMKVTSFR